MDHESVLPTGERKVMCKSNVQIGLFVERYSINTALSDVFPDVFGTPTKSVIGDATCISGKP